MRITIFANGVLPDLNAARRLLRADDLIICADGGWRHARALGLLPRALIGDLDSTDEREQAQLNAAKVEIRRYPHDKDQTDLELAFDYALQQQAESIVVIAALGGRLDHTLGNIALLSDPRLIGRDCCLDDGVEQVRLCRDQVEVHGLPRDLVSLLPWQGPAVGVRTEGLRWQLSGETLFPDRSRGISNELLANSARIRIETGVLLVVHKRLLGSASPA